MRLHIRGVDEKGSGVHFPTGTFFSKLNPKYNPENGIQARLGYFIIPPSHAETFQAKSLSRHILKELEIREGETLIGYFLFVHPEAYVHYQALHDAKIPFVKPQDSKFMGTPTSSYRSWLVRRTGAAHAPPFIVKMGVSSSPTDVSRLIPCEEVKRSIDLQARLDQTEQDLLMFRESFGLTVKKIKDYPADESNLDGKPVDSGMIIREVPKDLLEQKVKIMSFSAVMSVEASLPLIYKIMDTVIKKGLVKTPVEFVRKYLIEDYLKAIEKFHFKGKLSFSPHGQNLMWVLSEDGIPLGFAYRDLEGVSTDASGYIESFSWFWRYHIFVKLLNVITKLAPERMPPPPGAPSQMGWLKKPMERNLQPVILPRLQGKALEIFESLSVTPDEAIGLLKYLDQEYLKFLSRYFDVEAASILTKKGNIPAAEKGSRGEFKLVQYNSRLWKHAK